MRFLSDSVVVDRTEPMPVQVLSAGLPRCATSSLQTALESQHIRLNPCMHFAYIAPHANRGDILLAASRENDTARRHKLLHKLFGGFQATTDFPGSMLMDDLMDMYPDAKIILNKRPGGGHQREQSIKVLLFARSPVYSALCFLWKTDRNLCAMWHSITELCQRKLGLTTYEVWTAKHYDAHNAWIRAEAAKRVRKVLEFEPRDGWESLCTFIGKERPEDEPFPHRNDAAEVRMITRILYARGAISWLVLGGMVFGAVSWLVKGQFF
ncbi:hypothetical protein N7448_005736 [Penicillium atrosanguineum]|uniref:Uncharacterized protein n=1 Tax=Penicillium atrosanguineum TaxID=1132637 RepID=A0A9W9H405_9EURO|nr:Dihydrolipoyllysine-residue acetyltransferase component of pyruvate dehydrogenase complex [Penicillium atrosanguineum]KAJ5126435.1 hypothetical protein N7526_008612 [Penicillium atrosanguineum]KAJ5137182.1 hypothetical protein N7448_005736 [Penicillium atrosanguineum]KAJ5293521.1 Dihydrolipoyllysine-residue acetyltransferase component of pyruvate dehydrogenase complex [Penicillium atrosanguineum]KAJ5302440.1 hypothetical protein N7476_009239 [Penicillium atrosanguineum]